MRHRELEQTLYEIRRGMTKAQLVKFAENIVRDENVPYEALMSALDEAQRKDLTMYAAIMNTPGYLPWAEDNEVFDTPGEAWEYLAQERRDQEDNLGVILASDEGYTDQPYSGTVDTLDAYASAAHGEDVVYGGTPGYDGSHDLGIAYSVVETEDES